MTYPSASTTRSIATGSVSIGPRMPPLTVSTTAMAANTEALPNNSHPSRFQRRTRASREMEKMAVAMFPTTSARLSPIATPARAHRASHAVATNAPARLMIQR